MPFQVCVTTTQDYSVYKEKNLDLTMTAATHFQQAIALSPRNQFPPQYIWMNRAVVFIT